MCHHRELYSNETTWNMLLKRDFNMNGTREMYQEAYLVDLERFKIMVIKQAMKNIDPKKKSVWEKNRRKCRDQKMIKIYYGGRRILH